MQLSESAKLPALQKPARVVAHTGFGEQMGLLLWALLLLCVAAKSLSSDPHADAWVGDGWRIEDASAWQRTDVDDSESRRDPDKAIGPRAEGTPKMDVNR